MALKVGKIIKWSLITVVVLLVLFVGAAIAIPYFYKDEILNRAKEFANEQINATVDFDNDKVGLSLLWTFPDFSFKIGDLTVTGHDEFKGKKLADIGNFNFTINLMDAWNGNYTINGIELKDADLYVKVLKNGKANYDIMKPSEEVPTEDETTDEETSGQALQLRLRYYAVKNTNVIYDNETTNIYVEVKNLNHSGSGEFTATNYDLYTLTNIDALTVVMDRIKYLNKTNVEVTFNADIDTKTGKYKLLDNSFRLNALVLKAEGEVNMKGEGDIGVDLKFGAPNTSFASVLSMIPAAYTKDFEDVQTKGKFNFDGYTKGNYNGKTGSLPAFGINLEVADGEFKYPDLPLAVEDINTKMSVRSQSADLDKMEIDVNTFHVKIGKNPFDASLKLRTPMSDPDIDTKIDGTIDLDQLAQAFPMEGVDKLSGIIKANLMAKTKMSYVNNNQYDKVDMNGMLAVSNVDYFAKDLPKVKVKNVEMNFTPNKVDLKDFDLNIGKSDIKGNGTLDNILTYFSRDKIMTGVLNVRSKLLDLNEISSAGGTAETEDKEEETEAPKDDNLATSMEDTTQAVDEQPIFDQFDFMMDAEINKIVYDVYDIKDFKTTGSFTPSTAELDNFEMKIGKVDIQAKGSVDNVFGYVFDDETLKGVLHVYSNYMNLNQFMSDDGKAVEPEPKTEIPDDVSEVESDLEPIQIPGNIDFSLITRFNEFIYDSYNLKNVFAEVHVHDHILDINTLQADGFGGGLAMSGTYDTKVPEKPKFKLAYNLQKLDIQTIAKEVGLSKRLLPVLESIYGKFNSEMEVSGILDKNLYPDLTTLSAKGLLQTYNAVVKDNKSLENLSEKLKMPDLKTVKLDNTTNFFSVKDGRLFIDPASHNIKGMDVIFGGSHGLDKTMDYDMKMRVPRDMLSKNPLGKAANDAVSTGLGALAGQASKLGIELKDSKYVNVGVGITGTLTKPKFKVKLLGAEGKGGETIGDQVANKIKEEANRLKEEAEAKAKAEAERLKKEAEERIEKEKERLKKEAEEKAKKLANQAKNDPGSVKDSLQNILKGKDKKKFPNVFGDDKDGKDDKDKKKNPFGPFKNPFKK